MMIHNAIAAVKFVRASRNTPYDSLARLQFRKWGYLISYVLFSLGLIEKLIQNYVRHQSNSFFGYLPLVLAVNLVSFIAPMILLFWVKDYYDRHRKGMFPDLYLAGGRVQEVMNPLLWRLSCLALGLSAIHSTYSLITGWNDVRYGVVVFPLVLLGGFLWQLSVLGAAFAFISRGGGVAAPLLILSLARLVFYLLTHMFAPFLNGMGRSVGSYLLLIIFYCLVPGIVDGVIAWVLFSRYFHTPREALVAGEDRR